MFLGLLQTLEIALSQRNPSLAGRLQPGIPEPRIRAMLDQCGVGGKVEPVVSLFSWKNGVDNRCQELSMEQASLFPKSIYMFMELDVLLSHFVKFKECLPHHPEYVRVAGGYFPLFWDGSNSWLAVDLAPAGHSRVVLLHPEFEEMLFQVYSSFEEFLIDAIRGNQQNEALPGFSSLGPIS